MGDAAVEAQLLQVFDGVLGPDEGPRRVVEPIVKARQQKAERTAACQKRQRRKLRRRERPDRAIVRKQRPGFGDVEAAVILEAPGVETNGKIVGEEISAREVEVDDAGNALAAKEDVVGEEIGVDDTFREMRRPARLEL